jgi:hypothetical protein
MRGAGHADVRVVLQMPGNKADAVHCECLQNLCTRVLPTKGTAYIDGVDVCKDLGHANLTAAFAILLLTIVSSTGLGIVSASFIMTLKTGDPVGWLFVQVSGLICGLNYPLSVLPDWLQTAAKAMPVTY